METNGKFIVQLTGPVVKYRLEIIKDACPNAKDFLIYFTNKESYPLYKEYHDYFNFVIMDDYREKYPISLKYEQLPNYKTEKEYFDNIHSFYGSSNDKFYPYDLHRFALLYLMENHILNFCIIDSDFILINNPELINETFEKIPNGCVYGPWHGEDQNGIDIKLNMWKNNIQPLFPDFKLESPFLRTVDGFARGFKFRNIDEMKLLFDIWNCSLETIFLNDLYRHQILGNNGLLYHAEWVISHIMQFFEHQLNYEFKDSHSVLSARGKNIGIHKTRPEDTIALGSRSCWDFYGFDYSDLSSISAFIKNNKKQLHLYYSHHFQNFEITDNFVYSRLE